MIKYGSARRQESSSHICATIPDRQSYVGPDERAYYIHRDLLCARSEYFRAALSGDFKEAKTNEIVLDEDDPEILEAFVYWLYYGQLAGTTVADPSAADFQARASVGLTQMQLVNVWIWGDMRKIPALQNHALKDLDLHYREIGLLDIDIFRRVCTGTPPRSSLRRFAGMLAAGIKNVEKDLEDEMQDPTFLAGMCEVLLKIRNHCPMGVVVEQTTMPVDEFFVEEKQSRSSHVPKESGA